MIPYIIVTILSVIMAAMVKKVHIYAGEDNWPQRREVLNKLWILSIFMLLFALSALRYKVGNDYTRYEEFFHLIPLKQVVPTEAGFNISVLIIQWIFGGEAALPIFTIYAFITIAFMIKAVYDQSRDFLFSFFLFMTLSFYFQSLNTVRYYLAWSVAVFSMKYVLKKEYLKFVCIILITSTIHKSVLLVLPVYIICSMKLKKIHYIIITLIALSGIVLRSFYLDIIVRLYPSYEGTQYLTGGTSVINIIRIVAVFILSLLCYKNAVEGDRQMEFYFRLNFMALLLYTCGSFVPEISRIGYYMSAGHIFLIPALVKSIKNKHINYGMHLMTVASAIIYFAVFLHLAKDPLVRIVPYHTWVLTGTWF